MNQPFEPDVITYDERTSELDLRALRRALARKRQWIIWPTLLTFLGVGVYVTLTKPMYTAELQVLLENQENFLTRPQRADVGTDNTTAPDPESVASQVQLITSRDLAARVVEKLGLIGDPEFDPAAKGIGPISRALILHGTDARSDARAGGRSRHRYLREAAHRLFADEDARRHRRFRGA